jgi:MFS family permease
MSYVFALFGWSYVVLMPVLAADVLGVDPSRQGGLLAAAGLGASVVTVMVAVAGHRLVRRRGLMVIGGGASSGIALTLFALTTQFIGSFWLAVLLIFVVGLTQTVFTTGAMGALQLAVPNAMRGRILGVYAIVWGIMPLSGAQAAFMAGFTGVPVAIAVGGLVIALFALGPALFNPRIRALGTSMDTGLP